MNSDQFTGIIRAIVPGIVGYLAGKGLIPQSAVGDFGNALVTIISVLGIAAWSWHTNKTGKVIGQ